MDERNEMIGPIHPGEFLKDMLDEIEISAYALANAIGKAPIQVTRILNGQASITAPMARRIGKALGLTPEMLMNWQARYDLEVAETTEPEIKVTNLMAQA
ncbi:MAG TPA: HigA family addiction module antitoxin [Xanthomonadales bacterium]|nr:HigA family addiction module antitoxin [Xanthomonadales bacterium]